MGTIRTREKANGDKSYTAIVRIKNKQIIVHNETQTFPKKALAQAWIKRREAELQQQKATGVVNLNRVTIEEILEAYVKQAEGVTRWGRTKTADIKRLRESGLSNKDARYLTAADIIQYAKHRRTVDEAGPATVMNDIIWLRQAFLTGVAMFNLSQPLLAVDAAKKDLLRTKTISKPKQRARRVSEDEENKILEHYRQRTKTQIPMVDVIQFALLTARRQDEICRMKWEDVDLDEGTGWVDDVKHPTRKIGNRREFRILKPAIDIIKRQPRVAPEIFPYNSKSVGASFTRAMHLLEIEDLHFHDLRHEATSRLFEKGYSIQEVAHFTLHESWATLKRYTHLRPKNIPER